MLNQKGQHLKIITAVFSVFVLLLLTAPAVFATTGKNANDSGQIIFTNEVFLGGKRMIVETRIYAAPDSAQASDAQNAFIRPADGKIIQGYRQGHYAIDIAGGSDSTVVASRAGKVIRVVSDCEADSYGCGGGYGNHVVIDHGDGLTSMYAHLASVAVNEGDIVTQRQAIGMMGRSGSVKAKQGIHLHFEVRDNGLKKNPADYIGE